MTKLYKLGIERNMTFLQNKKFYKVKKYCKVDQNISNIN